MLYPATFPAFRIPISPEITISGVRTPTTGPPLLLLHGFPQTHAIWHKVAPVLAPHYTLIIPDLRGYGGSSKPPSTPDHRNYAKSAMAQDMVSLMSILGHSTFYICAHDRGARVAHSLCINHPAAVTKAILLDISPTDTMYSGTDQELATAYFHWFFLIQPAPFPETLLGAAPKTFLNFAMKKRHPEAVFADEAWVEYERAWEDKENIRAGCEDYRAAATVDLEEQRREREEGRRIKAPLRVLWGKSGVVEKKFDCVRDWEEVCEGGVQGEALECGHYIPEERPEDVIRHVKEFFV